MFWNASEIFQTQHHVLKRINPEVESEWERESRITKKVDRFGINIWNNGGLSLVSFLVNVFNNLYEIYFDSSDSGKQCT